LFYSGGAEDQIQAFKAKNPSYLYYSDVFDAPDKSHPWYEAFKSEKVSLDDGEASSRALASIASGHVLVFGAIKYKTAGAVSFSKREEIDILHEGIETGRIKSINHMVKGATSPSQVLAKEGARGRFTWQKGHKEGEKNASGPYGQCKRGLGGCDAPKLKHKPKPKSNSSACGKEKRAGASKGACPIKSEPSASVPTKKPAAVAPTKKPAAVAPTKKPANTGTNPNPKAAPAPIKRVLSLVRKGVPDLLKGFRVG
jgi:hypothetical protein